MRRRRRHRLILEDRGESHVHRYVPSCACGRWIGVAAKMKWATEQYHGHLRSPDPDRVLDKPPRALTPAEKLPEELR